MRKKFVVITAVVVFALIIALSACGGKDETIEFPEMKEYSLTEGSGSHVADVPYDEYLQTPVFTDGVYRISATEAGASQDKSAAENTAALQAAIDKASAEGDGKGAVVGCTYKSAVYPVKNVTLENINIAYRKCNEDLNIYNGSDALHANMSGYPEITRVSHSYLISHELSAYYDMPVYGLYLYNAENVKATSFNVIARSVNTRPFTNAGLYDERDGIVNSSVSSDN